MYRSSAEGEVQAGMAKAVCHVHTPISHWLILYPGLWVSLRKAVDRLWWYSSPSKINFQSLDHDDFEEVRRQTFVGGLVLDWIIVHRRLTSSPANPWEVLFMSLPGSWALVVSNVTLCLFHDKILHVCHFYLPFGHMHFEQRNGHINWIYTLELWMSVVDSWY